jgi:UDP-N-acetylglucosamine--N-acetylmuramyl-(pentapeptide) pyrophosphoryl-undecaprenol N-acetylglucosamine transferase
MRLLIAGGGTGGHFYPGVAVAQELLSREGGHRVHFAGSATGIEARKAVELGHEFTPVRCGPLVGSGLGGKVRSLWSVLRGMNDARRLISSFNPDACLGVGGYASFPVTLTCKLRGVCTAINEQNAVPGLANRVLARWVKRIYAADAEAAAGFDRAKTVITGTPLRGAFREAFGYDAPRQGEPVRVLVLGGSQGAEALNREVPLALKALSDSGHPIEVRHQAGPGKTQEAQAAYGDRQLVTVESFIDDMGEAYRWSQLVIARAGALTLAELAAAGRPALLVPFPHAAANHQEANALSAQRVGAAHCMLEAELTAERLAGLIGEWLASPGKLVAMAEAASQYARRDAAKRIVDDLIDQTAGKPRNRRRGDNNVS